MYQLEFSIVWVKMEGHIDFIKLYLNRTDPSLFPLTMRKKKEMIV